MDSLEETVKICRELSYKFTDDREYIENEIINFAKNTLCIELIPEYMSGKEINES